MSHRQFTPEQKASAVETAKTSAKAIAQIAREMDLSESALRNWVQQAQVQPNSSVPTPSPEHAELQQLRRELKRVGQERDFLKKSPPAWPKTAHRSLRANRGTEGSLPDYFDVSSPLGLPQWLLCLEASSALAQSSAESNAC